MRLVIITAGTLGDVLPLVHLGARLQRDGHRVRLATHEPLLGHLGGTGLEPYGLPGDPASMFEGNAWRAFSLSRRRPLAHAQALHSGLAGLVDQLDEAALEPALRGQDAVVFSPTASLARTVAERRDLPSVMTSLTPLHRTRAFAQPVLAPGLRLGGLGNLASYPLAERLLRQPFAEPLRPRARRARGLSAVPLLDGDRGGWPPFPVLCGFSPVLVPPPADWPAHLHVTGEWRVPAPSGAALPEAVDAFLADGPPPVFVTFGSMRPGFADRLSAALAAGVASTGHRVLIQSTWLDGSGLDPARSLVVTGPLPHDLLLRRVAGVVHHGGAGTSHAVLRAGRPAWVCGFVFDQLFWGFRVHRAGAGPAPVPAARLTGAVVAHALRALAAPAVAAAAERAAAAMSAYDGVARAAALLPGLLGMPGSAGGGAAPATFAPPGG